VVKTLIFQVKAQKLFRWKLAITSWEL